MQFVNIDFPERIAMGAQSDAGWSTDLATSLAGFDFTNENWQDARHYFDLAFAIRNRVDYLLVRAHFHEVRGRARKFLFKDFLDFEVSTAEGLLLTDGLAPITANGTYYLHKRYGATNPYYRKITRPDSPISVFRTRSSTTTNITGAGAAVTYNTGEVAITGHMSGDTYAWGGTFKVPARYDIDRLPGVAINKEPGADGELLVQCDSIPVVEVKE